LRWSGYLDEALAQTVDAEVLFMTHSWPAWGHERIAALLTAHRDTYKYIHDQTVRLLNAGLTIGEVADRVTLPASLQAQLGSRGYYGDVRHNARAVYQFYLGAYDGNPAHLDPLPPESSAPRYVALMGGAANVVAAAQQAFDSGEYRWAAELLDRVVFAEPANDAAKQLLARTYDQLGYGAESATWRNAYLTGAQELRNGPPTRGVDRSAFLALLAETPIERFLEAMAAGLDGPAAEGKDLTVNLVLSDTKESFVLWIENAVLHHRAGPPASDADATLTLTKQVFIRMMAGQAGAKDLLFGKDVRITGSRVDLLRFFSLIDKAPGTFAIVTP
jgi:alkyl sulfatase BDS1-like metallo-beta-lactamase superfamily hydrolase